MPLELPAPLFPVPYTMVIPGSQLLVKGIYVYQCPLCKKVFRYDDPYEPMCTGPSETRNDHPPEVMRRINRDTSKVFIYKNQERL